MSVEEKKEVDVTKSDETKNTEKKDDITIPKSRFDEVNNAKKELEAKLAAIEAEKEADRQKKLEEDGKLKEVLDITRAENEKLKLEGMKRDMIQEAITNKKLHPRLAKMVIGSTKEEIEQSLEEAIAYDAELKESLKNDRKATDTTGGNGKSTTGEMTTEEWMRLYEEDPKKADAYLREKTEAANKQ